MQCICVPGVAYDQLHVGFASYCVVDSGLEQRQASHQKKAAQYLQSECETVLSSYATCVSTDQQLLQQQQSLAPRLAQAIRARLEHKVLIATAVELLRTYINTIPIQVNLKQDMPKTR